MSRAEPYRAPLYEAVAQRLSGRPVELHWRYPEGVSDYRHGKRVRWLGATSRRGNKAIIEIDPELTDEKHFDVFLHECAHARSHANGYRDYADPITDDFSKAPATWGERIAQAKYGAEEIEADEQASRWRAYAERHGHRNTITSYLIALLRYPTNV